MLSRPLFPVLFALYPIVFVFARNRDQLTGSELWLPLGIAMLGVSLVWSALARLQRSALGSAFTTTLVLVFFFGFGAVRDVAPAVLQSSAAAPLLALWVATLALFGVWILRAFARRPGAFQRLVPALNIAALILLAMPCFALARAWAPANSGSRLPWGAEKARSPLTRSGIRPDLYHIILDGYGHHDTLRTRYGFDNGSFRRHLEARGFTVGEESRSNYLRTIHSIASMHNMHYVPDSAIEAAANPHDLRPLAEGVRDSFLLQTLEAEGYTTWAFESGYAATELTTVDHFIETEGGISEFQTTVLNLTPIPVLLSLLPAPDQFDLHRRRILDALDALPRVAAEPGPKFVFVHLLAPHPPFVFGRNGESVPSTGSYSLHDGIHFLRGRSRADYLVGYAEQVAFITERVQVAIDGILDNASRASVIVVQGDHGPGSDFRHEVLGDSNLIERGFILNAVRLPGGRRVPPSATITPINTFRFLVGAIFQMNLQPLEDRTYFNTESSPYRFEDVTERFTSHLARRRRSEAKVEAGQ